MSKTKRNFIIVLLILLVVGVAIYFYGGDGTFSTVDGDCSYEPLIVENIQLKDFDAVREEFDIPYTDEELETDLFLQERTSGVFMQMCKTTGGQE
jgi:hypothetical protein